MWFCVLQPHHVFLCTCTLNPVVLFILLYCTMWLCVLCSTLSCGSVYSIVLYHVVLCTLLYYTCGSVYSIVLHQLVLCTLLNCTMWFCVHVVHYTMRFCVHFCTTPRSSVYSIVLHHVVLCTLLYPAFL